MVSLESTLANTLSYSAQFNFPLTSKEVWFWQINSQYSQAEINSFLSAHYKSRKSLFFLNSSHVTSRLQNETFSQAKWGIAKKFARKLSQIPFVAAIFVTGALAMNNSPKEDDIDLMIVTYPHTLWLTRLLVLLFLGNHRRPASIPEHSSSRVSNKVCDNLYLTTESLLIKTQNLYTAHEILQAQCVYDRFSIPRKFLSKNNWVRRYLPQAYKQISNKHISDSGKTSPRNQNYSYLKILNYVAYKLQYLYMYKKITNEKISINSAFFHPRNKLNNINFTS